MGHDTKVLGLLAALENGARLVAGSQEVSYQPRDKVDEMPWTDGTERYTSEQVDAAPAKPGALVAEVSNAAENRTLTLLAAAAYGALLMEKSWLWSVEFAPRSNGDAQPWRTSEEVRYSSDQVEVRPDPDRVLPAWIAEQVTVTSRTPRQCFWISGRERTEGGGYIPSVVTENAAGYLPLAGDGTEFARPYDWGKSMIEAQSLCDKQNMVTYGLSPEEAKAIVLSSMRVSNLERGGRGPDNVSPNELAAVVTEWNLRNHTGDAQWFWSESPLSLTAQDSGRLRRVEFWLMTAEGAQSAGWEG